MWNPATAFVWEWWRTTRRPLLFFVALGGLIGWLVLSRTEPADVPRVAFPVFLLLVTVATLAWVAMLARSARNGFPMTLAFARPVHTRLLVAVPLAYLAAACAATYAVPADALRLAYGAPLPVVPVAVLLAAGAVWFAACNWFTRSAATRFGASIILLGALGPALRWLDPWNAATAGGQSPPWLTVDSVALGGMQYAAIALAIVVAYIGTVRGVEQQRRGDSEVVRGRRGLAAADRIATRSIAAQVRDVVTSVVRVPCPTSSPLVAEIWIEATARGLPVLAIGALLALAMPVMFAVLNTTKWIGSLAFVGFAALLPFFVSVSTSFWNREGSLRAPMSSFEAARPITTGQLAAVQIGVVLLATGAAWCLIAASAWWSLPLFGDVLDYATLKGGLARTLAAAPYWKIAAGGFVALVIFAGVVALLAALRALTALYGMRLWIGAVVLLAYLLFVAFGTVVEWWGQAMIGAHFWVVTVAIPLLTVWATLRAIADRSLKPAHAAVLAAVWALFVAALALLENRGAGLAPAAAAAVLAYQLLPLTGAVLWVWALGRIRHA